MTAYRVTYRYRAWYGGERFDWQPGQVVDLSPAQAEWANRDCTGVLVPVRAEPEPEPAPVVEPAPPTGPAEAEPTADEPTTAVPADPKPVTEPAAEPPARRRGGRPRKSQQ